MIKEIIRWFLKPYPFIQGVKNILLLIGGVSLFIFLFLLFFKPFNFDELQGNMVLYALDYALITLVAMSVIFFLLPLLFNDFFNPNTWVIYKMLLLILGIILTISLGNWLFTKMIVDPGRIVKHDLLFFLSATAMVGFFPSLLYIYITERIANKQHKNIAKSISDIQKTTTNKVTNTINSLDIELQGENKNEIIIIDITKILYITSEKNYVSIYYLENDNVKEKLIRNSLTKVSKQLKGHKQIVRCHKSYIVNSHFVEEIQGNARSYLLKISNLKKLIPVSRSFPKELLYTLVG
jgi:hypothetical protein